MRRLVCAFVVRKPPKTGFLASRPIYNYMQDQLFIKVVENKNKNPDLKKKKNLEMAKWFARLNGLYSDLDVACLP